MAESFLPDVSPDTSPLDAALLWASSGRAVFPCTTNGKAPLTTSGFQDATTDDTAIRLLAGKHSGCNWGCWPGYGREVVLDFDPGKADDAGRKLLDRLRGVTASVLTPTSGVHLWFALPPRVTLTNETGSLPAGWDVRSANGYVLIPPSTVSYTGEAATKKGVGDGHTGCYRVLNPGPVEELPADVRALIQQPKAKTRKEAHSNGRRPGHTPLHRSPPMSDAEVLNVVGGPKLPTAGKFNRLWAGDTTGYQSTSEAVLALVNLLSYVTQDEDQVD